MTIYTFDQINFGDIVEFADSSFGKPGRAKVIAKRKQDVSKTYFEIGLLLQDPLKKAYHFSSSFEFWFKEYHSFEPLSTYHGKHLDWCNVKHIKLILPTVNGLQTKSSSITSGMKCNVCSDYNEYAQPNMKDDTYRCYRCRENPFI